MFFHFLVHHELLTAIFHEDFEHQLLILLSFEFEFFTQDFLELIFDRVELLHIRLLFTYDFLYLFRKRLESLQIDVRNIVGDLVKHGFMISD